MLHVVRCTHGYLGVGHVHAFVVSLFQVNLQFCAAGGWPKVLCLVHVDAKQCFDLNTWVPAREGGPK